MIDRNAAEAFARNWAQAWNDRDLDAILAHYAEDVVFHSPRIAVITGEDVASISGKPALASYWSKALALAPSLYFEVDCVLNGSDAVTILYTNHRDETVAETFVFGGGNKVVQGVATYG